LQPFDFLLYLFSFFFTYSHSQPRHLFFRSPSLLLSASLRSHHPDGTFRDMRTVFSSPLPPRSRLFPPSCRGPERGSISSFLRALTVTRSSPLGSPSLLPHSLMPDQVYTIGHESTPFFSLYAKWLCTRRGVAACFPSYGQHGIDLVSATPIMAALVGR